jgi:alpha-glucosidase
MNAFPWWRDAVFYQIYPRSFFDGNGDGEGDLCGITSHLGYVHDLGVDAIWLSPFYSSPNKDGGYDVSDPRSVDPRHGTLDDAAALFARAHELNLKVIIDIIPNHFSSEHEWFKAALKSPRGSRERSRFHFYDTADVTSPPNNWISLFGGSAWTQIEDGQWYLHLFDSSQPDLNWTNPDVREDFEKTLRFWLDLGVDGFRIDVAHGLIKEEILKNHPDPQGLSDALRLDVAMDPAKRSILLSTVPFFDRDGVHEIYRQWRILFDSYDRDVMAVAEAWVHPPERATRYVRKDELHQVFNFDLLVAPFNDGALFDCIDRTLKLNRSVGASPTWALSNHDTPRLVSRIGNKAARAMALFTFALPGSCYIYQGQELGLPDAELADADRQDPAFFRTHGAQKGRDGARVPLPWNGSQTPFGFTTGTAWLPIPPTWVELSIAAQSSVASSSLEMYRTALTLRRKFTLDQSDFRWTRTPDGSGVISYRRGDIDIYLNTSDSSCPLSIGGDLLISSDGEIECVSGGIVLPAQACIWIQPQPNVVTKSL